MLDSKAYENKRNVSGSFDGLLGIEIRILTLGNMCGVYGSFFCEVFWRHPGIFMTLLDFN